MTLNCPHLEALTAILRDAGLVVGEPGSTVSRRVTPNDALRVVEAMEGGGFAITRSAP